MHLVVERGPILTTSQPATQAGSSSRSRLRLKRMTELADNPTLLPSLGLVIAPDFKAGVIGFEDSRGPSRQAGGR